eukprot:4046991-Amphidinium_carterae.1
MFETGFTATHYLCNLERSIRLTVMWFVSVACRGFQRLFCADASDSLFGCRSGGSHTLQVGADGWGGINESLVVSRALSVAEHIVEDAVCSGAEENLGLGQAL